MESASGSTRRYVLERVPALLLSKVALRTLCVKNKVPSDIPDYVESNGLVTDVVSDIIE